MKLLIVVALALAVLAGCSSVHKVLKQNELTIELAVRVAAGRVFDRHAVWVPAALSITGQGLQLLQKNPSVSLDGLENFVLQQIPWQDLGPEEQALVQVLIRSIRSELTANLEEKGVSRPGEATVKVGKVLFWINQSAKIHSLAGG